MNADVQLRKDLLAFTASEIQGLQTSLSSLTRESTKLADPPDGDPVAAGGREHGDAARPSARRSRASRPWRWSARRAPATSSTRAAGNDYFYQAANFQLILQAQLELITQAIICNAAPIIGLMPMYATCDFDFGFAGAPGAHHLGLSHTNYQAADYPLGQYNSPLSITNLRTDVRAPFATAQKWFFTQLVNKVVSVLATTDDPAAPGDEGPRQHPHLRR